MLHLKAYMAKQRLGELKKIRIEKISKLREAGIDPFPSKQKGGRTDIKSALKSEGKVVEVSGRIMGWREHGNVVFADLKDESGNIQLWFQKDNLRENFKILKLFDLGDFLYARGKVTKTKAGEITIDVNDFQLLTKSIRPLPSKWHGIKDEEIRYRQRYVDLILNEKLKELFRKKAIFWQSMRDFFLEKGFLEVETPVLENTAGGADANPFVTHHNALDIDLYLRISMGELWQKRLMVAGFEKTFEIGRQFRNEGLSREHLQDYTQMEFYWAYANYEDSMDLVEEMYKFVAKKTFGTLKFKIGKHVVDLAKPWKKIDYTLIIKEKTGIDLLKATKKDIINKLIEHKVEVNKKDSIERLIDTLWKQVRRDVSGPAFLINHPVEISPLAKRKQDDPKYVERYQVILAGSEMGNGYSELNDPIDQAERFESQQKLRDEGDEEAQMHDADFVRALEYGMPPTSGFGVSERLFSFLADLPARETVLFPLLRPEGEMGKKKKISKAGKSKNTRDMDLGIDYKKAKKLVEENIKDEITKMHLRESEVIMRALAKHFGEDEEKWGIIGLLHDIDWEVTKDDTKNHGLVMPKILKDAGASEFLVSTIGSHIYGYNNKWKGEKRKGKLQHSLAAAETLTGLIIASTLVQPSKKLKDVKLSSLKKKFKQKSFAAKCDRNVIMEIEKTGLKIDEFLEMSLKALQGISGELGL